MAARSLYCGLKGLVELLDFLRAPHHQYVNPSNQVMSETRGHRLASRDRGQTKIHSTK